MDRLVRRAAVAVFSVALGGSYAAPALAVSPIVEITSPEGDRVSITSSNGVLAREVGGILEADLALEDLSRSRRLHPAMIVDGSIAIESDKIAAELRWTDARDGKVISKRTYGGRGDRGRAIAHELAREIAVHLTGQKSMATTKIVAVKDGDLFVMDLGGGAMERLTSGRAITSRPSWSRDGRTLLFTSSSRRAPELYSMRAFGGSTASLISREPGLNSDGRFSPDGKRITLTLSRDGNSEVYVLEDRRYTRLTNEWAMDSSAVWSPDGQKIAFVSSRTGHAELYVMSANGGAPIRLTHLEQRVSSPDWSPRGDRIVFSSRDAKGIGDIYSVDPSTGAIARLTRDRGSNFDPSFSPDGRHVVFVSTRASAAGDADLWIMDAGGSSATRISRGGGFSAPSWSPFLDETIDMNRDGGPYLSLSSAH